MRVRRLFGWDTNRDIEEWGIVNYLSESLASSGKAIFKSLKKRGRPNDPPDCEALDENDQRIAIEVTELVNEEAIKSVKAGNKYDFANWDIIRFRKCLDSLIQRKDSHFNHLKNPPYNGGYFLVIFTDEPMLNRNQVEVFLTGYAVNNTQHLSKVFLLISYDPTIEKCHILN